MKLDVKLDQGSPVQSPDFLDKQQKIDFLLVLVRIVETLANIDGEIRKESEKHMKKILQEWK